MVLDLIENIIAALFIPAFILHILHYRWFKKYNAILFTLLQVVAGAVYGLILVTPKLLIGLIKTVLVSIVGIFLVLVYSITFIVPYAGKIAGEHKDNLKDRMESLYFTTRVRQMRDLMVRIVAEEDEIDLRFEETDEYRSELNKVKQNAKSRLETGETALSVLLGSVLLFANIGGVELMRSSIFEISVSLLIEAWLLVITASIIYRSSVLEFLTYSPDENFGSLERMDAALSYQRGISLVGFMQGLTFLLVFVVAISRVRLDIIESALRAKYIDEPWVAVTWEEIVSK